MADNEATPDNVPPPQIDPKAFKEAQFAPRRKDTAQMTSQSKGDK